MGADDSEWADCAIGERLLELIVLECRVNVAGDAEFMDTLRHHDVSSEAVKLVAGVVESNVNICMPTSFNTA